MNRNGPNETGIGPEDAFAEANCRAFTLSDYPTLLEIAIKLDYVKPDEKETLLKWYQSPAEWGANSQSSS